MIAIYAMAAVVAMAAAVAIVAMAAVLAVPAVPAVMMIEFEETQQDHEITNIFSTSLFERVALHASGRWEHCELEGATQDN